MIDLNVGIEQLLGPVSTGLLQGMAVTALVAAGLRLMTRLNAATRHAILLITLLIVAMLPAVHLAAGWPLTGPVAAQQAEPAILEIRNYVESAPSMEEDAGAEARAIASMDAAPAVASEALPVFEAAVVTAEAPQAVERIKSAWTIPSLRKLSAAAGIIWMALAAGRLARLGWECRLLRRAKAAARPAPEPVQAALGKLRVELASNRLSRVLVSRAMHVPLAAGFFHPAILLPEQLLAGAGERELEQILRHEAAHLARRDDWANLLQQLIHAALFFHPAVWWLSRRLTIEREIACDDAVVQRLGDARARRDYALFLTEFASLARGAALLAAPAGWRRTTQLKERVNMILDTKRNASPRLAPFKVTLIAVGAAAVAALGLTHGPRIAFAAEAADVLQPAAEAGEEAAPKIKPAVGAAPVAELRASAPTAANVPAATLVAPSGAAIAFTAPAVEAVPAAHPAPPPKPPRHVHPAHPPQPVHPAPAAPPGGYARGPHGASLEERLARLEAMVSSLMAERGKPNVPGQPPFAFSFKGAEPNPYSRHEAGEMEQHVRRDIERAEREVARAHRDVERAMRERAVTERDEELRRDLGFEGKKRDSAKQSLAQQRKQIQEQMRALERELRTLEREEERLQEREAQVKEPPVKPKEKSSDTDDRPKF